MATQQQRDLLRSRATYGYEDSHQMRPRASNPGDVFSDRGLIAAEFTGSQHAPAVYDPNAPKQKSMDTIMREQGEKEAAERRDVLDRAQAEGKAQADQSWQQRQAAEANLQGLSRMQGEINQAAAVPGVQAPVVGAPKAASPMPVMPAETGRVMANQQMQVAASGGKARALLNGAGAPASDPFGTRLKMAQEQGYDPLTGEFLEGLAGVSLQWGRNAVEVARGQTPGVRQVDTARLFDGANAAITDAPGGVRQPVPSVIRGTMKDEKGGERFISQNDVFQERYKEAYADGVAAKTSEDQRKLAGYKEASREVQAAARNAVTPSSGGFIERGGQEFRVPPGGGPMAPMRPSVFDSPYPMSPEGWVGAEVGAPRRPAPSGGGSTEFPALQPSGRARPSAVIFDSQRFQGVR